MRRCDWFFRLDVSWSSLLFSCLYSLTFLGQKLTYHSKQITICNANQSPIRDILSRKLPVINRYWRARLGWRAGWLPGANFTARLTLTVARKLLYSSYISGFAMQNAKKIKMAQLIYLIEILCLAIFHQWCYWHSERVTPRIQFSNPIRNSSIKSFR